MFQIKFFKKKVEEVLFFFKVIQLKKLPEKFSLFTVGFEPIAEASRVHHILLYGCRKPFKENQFWKGGQTCITPGHILYSWARNGLLLIKFLVIQVLSQFLLPDMMF